MTEPDYKRRFDVTDFRGHFRWTKKCPKCGKERMVQIYEILPEYFDYIVPNKKKEICNTS